MMLSDLKPRNISHRIVSNLAPYLGAFPINDATARTVSPIMIVGCGRSGNTLLRSMLVHGGEVAIPPESYVWSTIARGFSRWRFSSWPEIAAHVVDAFRRSDFGLSDADFVMMKGRATALPPNRRSLASLIDLVYDAYCELNDFAGRRWGDKTPLNILDIKVIEGIFPAAQYVHIVRDPRAVAQSIMTAAKTSPGIRERSYEQAAERWNKSVRNARLLARRVGPYRYREVKYEDLVRDPERSLGQLCEFLGITYSPAMLSFHKGAARLGDVATIAHLARVQQPLDPTRMDSWKDRIGPANWAAVDRVTTKFRELYDYD